MAGKIPKWKKFQDDVQKYLQERESKEPLTYHRFYDSTSAMAFLPSQPADFLVVSRGLAILLEVKHSEVHRSLRSCFSSHVGDDQIAHHRIWQRAHSPTFFLFKSEIPEEDPSLELWEGKALVSARLGGKRLRNEWKIKAGPDLNSVLRDIYLWLPEERKLLL